MNKETRIENIAKILTQTTTLSEKIVWKDKLESMPVYEIPLKFLIFNKYNGRILSRTKSLETQGIEINPETEEGAKIISKLLYDSKKDRNDRTKEDLEKYGQKRVGIITRDGVIIDGNRRVMLLNQIDKFDYFRAIVLDVSSDQDPIEIEKLETTYQMGEDEKLSYNPIEVYLKTMELYKKLSGQSEFDEGKKDSEAIKKIYEWIGDYKSDEKIKGVEFRLKVMKTMNAYLDTFGYNGMFTQLDGREEQFRGLTRWLSDFYGEGSVKSFDGYKDTDVDDLKLIAFDFIRIKCKNTDFRYLAGGNQRKNHIFGSKSIWSEFLEHHHHIVSSYNEDEINIDSNNLSKTLDDRDDKFKKAIGEKLIKNLTTHYGKVRNQQERDKPVEQINKVIDIITSLDIRSKNFNKPEVLNLLEKTNQVTVEMLQEKSPKRTLKQIFALLSSIEIGDSNEGKEELLEYVKNIQKEAYQLEKRIKYLK
jgi:hypothetical protein